MVPVEQQQMAVFDENGDNLQRGDCMRAAVASVFELPLADVPHFVEHDNWWQMWNDWLEQRGLRIATAFFTLDDDDPLKLTGWPGDVYWLAIVKSPRGKRRCSTCNGDGQIVGEPLDDVDVAEPCPVCDGSGLVASLHAVVMFGREIVWDPHPQREMGHLGFVSGEQFRVIDPARIQLKPDADR